MIVIGLLLILVAAAATAAALLGGGNPTSVELYGYEVAASTAMFFVMGLAAMLVFAIGVWMFAAGTGRSARRRRELKRLRRQAETPAPAPAPSPASEPVTETTTPTVPKQTTSDAAGAHRDTATKSTS
jgi:hypothetical protein